MIEQAPGDPAELRAEETRAASRGFLVISGAKVWFLVTGTALNIGLPRLLDDPARFGAFGVVNSFLAILTMVLIGSALQAVSKRVSEAPAAARAVRAAGLRQQLVVGALVSGALLLGAGSLAGGVFNDPSLAPLFRLAAIVPLAYSLYAVLIGVLNGLRRFVAQALFDMGFATLKTGLMMGMVLAGLGVAGAFAGFGIAAITVLALAWAHSWRTVSASPGASPRVPLAGFTLQVAGYLLLTNCALQLDVLMLKGGAHGAVREALLDPARGPQLALQAALSGLEPGALVELASAEASSLVSGLFRATKNMALIPYQVVAAITFVLFPLVSRATSQQDAEASRAYLRQASRVAWLMVAAAGAVLAGGGEPLVVLLFGEAYRVAHPTLLPLLGGMAAFALLFVFANMLSAAGRPAGANLACGVTVAAQAAGVTLALRLAAPGPELLWATSIATCGASLLGFGVAAALVLRAYPGAVSAASLGRGAVAALAGWGAAGLVPGQGIGGIFVRAVAAAVAFAGALFATREITTVELTRVWGMLKGRAR